MILLINCKHSINIEKAIAQKANTCKDSCMISIKDLTGFKWDTLYVFNFPVSLEEINVTIGCDYKFYEEFTRPFIFFERGKIIHYENNNSNTEGLIKGQVIFTKYLVINVFAGREDPNIISPQAIRLLGGYCCIRIPPDVTGGSKELKLLRNIQIPIGKARVDLEDKALPLGEGGVAPDEVFT
jgi:hypothetical protein